MLRSADAIDMNKASANQAGLEKTRLPETWGVSSVPHLSSN
jgi:hypothetical protein